MKPTKYIQTVQARYIAGLDSNQEEIWLGFFLHDKWGWKAIGRFRTSIDPEVSLAEIFSTACFIFKDNGSPMAIIRQKIML